MRADLEYDIGDSGWLDSLKVGVRHADREQKVRYSIVQLVAGGRALDLQRAGIQRRQHGARAVSGSLRPCRYTSRATAKVSGKSTSLGDFYDGNVFPNGPMVFLNRATLADRDRHIEALSGATTNSPLAWTPLCQRANNTRAASSTRKSSTSTR